MPTSPPLVSAASPAKKSVACSGAASLRRADEPPPGRSCSPARERIVRPVVKVSAGELRLDERANAARATASARAAAARAGAARAENRREARDRLTDHALRTGVGEAGGARAAGPGDEQRRAQGEGGPEGRDRLSGRVEKGRAVEAAGRAAPRTGCGSAGPP